MKYTTSCHSKYHRPHWDKLDEQQRDLALLGYCPFCKQQIRNWKIPKSFITRREMLKNGIDDKTGHDLGCDFSEINL